MSKVYKVNEFIDILKHITTLPTIYYSGGNKWSSWNGTKWRFDCVVSIKSVLWVGVKIKKLNMVEQYMVVIDLKI